MEYKERKALLVEKNVSVVRPIARLDDDIVPRKTKRGAKKKYTPTRMKNAINKYFEWCEENDEIPSIKGMMIHLKLYKDSFYDYIKYEGFTEIMEQARLHISNWCETDVYNTKGMAAGKLAYMKNIHSWAEKIETNNYTEQRVVSVDEARSKLEMLAPKLLELLQNHASVVNQIAHQDAEVIEDA